jgi:hypothetical protein
MAAKQPAKKTYSSTAKKVSATAKKVSATAKKSTTKMSSKMIKPSMGCK